MVNNTNYRRPAQRPAEQRQSSDASCAELMRAIMEADFFATDLRLYLDTHPDDQRAMEMYREACKQYKACKAAFEDTFYPLTPCNAGKTDCWDWTQGVFPPQSV